MLPWGCWKSLDRLAFSGPGGPGLWEEDQVRVTIFLHLIMVPSSSHNQLLGQTLPQATVWRAVVLEDLDVFSLKTVL